MLWYPSTLTVANKAEITLWNQLQVALAQEEGIAFSRFPIFGAWGNRKSEPDVLLILRNYGVFILESKGCHIRNIASISGHSWQMIDWYKSEMKPWEQVDRQVNALNDLLKDSPFSKCVHGRVVLPFVSQYELKQTGLLPDEQLASVWSTDDLSSEQLLKALNKIRLNFPPPKLNDSVWEQLKGLFVRKNQSLELKSDKTTPVLITYEGDTPDNKQIQYLLKQAGVPSNWQKKDYTFLVATTKLEWERMKEFKPAHQVNKGDKLNTRRFAKKKIDDEDPVHLLFRNALRHLVPERIMSRSEERTLLRRAFERVAKGNEQQLQQLVHDIFIWRDALALLESEGEDLTTSPTEDVTAKFTVPSLANLAHQIFKAFEEEKIQSGKNDVIFERAVRNYLNNSFRPTPFVIMEGFSFLTPLQHFFIQRCTEMGAQVILIYPYREEQDYAFEVMGHTYSRFNKTPIRVSIPFKSQGDISDLSFLKRHLFSETIPAYTFQQDGTVTLTAFMHQHDEVAACVKKIKSYRGANRDPKDILIVTQDPEAYTPLLLEEATLQGLPSNTFNIPPRQLLLTPLGNFILGLYQVWQNGALQVTAEQFEAFIASGLIGRAQNTTDRYRASRDQWFANCQTKREWEDCFRSLEDALPDYKESNHLPISGITTKEVGVWRELLHTLEKLCQKLFVGTHLAIRDHVKKLLHELKLSVNSQEILATEKALLENIQEVLEELAEFDTLLVSTQEFGDLLSGLVQERKEVEETLKKNKINIVQPQGVDSSAQKIIFYLGLNNQSAPRPYAESWPLYHDSQEPHYQQERYLFLAVARATTERLHLSYAQADGNHVFQPSIYLKDVASCLHTSIVKENRATKPDELNDSIEAKKRETGGLVYGRRETYTLTELIHFKLCPFRYKLERLDSRAQQYTSKWALRFQAQGKWIGDILLNWSRKKEETKLISTTKRHLLNLMEQSKSDVVALFPGFDNVDWLSVEQGTIRSIEGMCRYDQLKAIYEVEVRDFSTSLVQDDEMTTVEESGLFYVTGPGYKSILRMPLIFEEWLLPRSKGDDYDLNLRFHKRDGVQVYTYDYDAFIDWLNLIKNFDDVTLENRKMLQDIVNDIKGNKFPKNQGGHCIYCPVRSTCLGVEE